MEEGGDRGWSKYEKNHTHTYMKMQVPNPSTSNGDGTRHCIPNAVMVTSELTPF